MQSILKPRWLVVGGRREGEREREGQHKKTEVGQAIESLNHLKSAPDEFKQ